jgi:hypothetical protein
MVMRGGRLTRVVLAVAVVGGGLGVSALTSGPAVAAPRTANLTPNGQSAVLTFSAGGQTGTASVQGLTGQQLTVTTTGGSFASNCGLQLTLLTQGGATVAGPVCAGQTGAVSSASLPSDGLYRANFVSGAGATGVVTVTATSSAGPASITTDAAPVTIAINAPNQDLRFGFSATAGQRVAVSSSAGSLPDCNVALSFVDKLGVQVGPSLDPCAGASGYAEAEITHKSTYYVKVLHNSTSESGTLKLFFTRVTDQTGAITTDGTPVAVNTAQQGQNARFSFAGTTGDRIAAQLSSSTIGPDCPAVAISLVRPDGSAFGVPASTCTTSAFLDTQTLDQTGTWTLLVDPRVGDSGTASLAVYKPGADQTGGILRDGTPVGLSLTTPGRNAQYTFTGTVGEHVSTLLTNSTIGAGCPAVVLSFVRPDASTDTTISTCGATAFLDTVVIDQAGAWTILVDPQGSATGTASLQAFDTADQVGLIQLDGSAGSVQITAPGQNARWHFTGNTDDVVSVALSSANFPGCPAFALSLERPDGTTLGSPVTTCGTAASLTGKTLDQTGTWNVVVDPQGSATGTATLQASLASEDQRPITINGAPVNVDLASGEVGQYTFSGTSGQYVSAQVASATFPGCTAYELWLKRPNGTQLGSTINGCGASAFLDRQILDATGIWTFVIDPVDTGSGTATLQAYSFVDETGTALLTGKATKLVLGKPGENGRFTFSGTIGQAISVNMTNSTITGCPAFTVSLERPDGSTLGSAVSTCTATVFLDRQTLDQNGTWTVVTDPQGPATGNVFMSVYDVIDDVRTMKLKVLKSFTAQVPGTNGHFKFAGSTGASRTFTITSSTFEGCPALVVSFVRPNGSVFSTNTTCNANLVLGPSVLDATGNWSVFIDPQGPAVGTLILKLT